MDIFKLSGNESTPDVCLDQHRGLFVFGGRSLPENAIVVYNPIISWFEEYVKKPNDETVVDISFEYINSSSMKQLAKLMVLFEEIPTNGGKLQVKWHYAPEDADTKAYGEHLAKLVSFPVSLCGDSSK